MTLPSLASRRAVMTAMGAALTGCATAPGSLGSGFAAPKLAPILMRPDRLIRLTVCTRPFRSAGPRLDVETVGDAKIVHNYGHGGSGWSLSWGSSAIAARKAMALSGLSQPGSQSNAPRIAVIGAGALGLTSALQLQRLGAQVVLYCRDRPLFTRSMRATGSWTPDSRIADVDQMSSDFPVLWEQMARETYLTHQTYLGLPGDPVSFSDRYFLSDADEPPKARLDLPVRTAPGIDNIRFAEFGDRLRGTTPRSFEIPADASPFPVNRTRKGSAMQFNVTALVHALQDEFLLQGGRFETRTFHTPGEIAELAEKVVINCTGYGARALFNDKTMIPVRGQIAWLAPQSEADYGLHYRGVMVLSRSDGIVVQNSRGDMNGVGIEDEVEDRDEARATIGVVAPLFGQA